MEKRPKFIGEILSELGLITPADIERALAVQQERGGYLGDALIQLGLISADQLNFGLADQFDLPFVHLRPESIDQNVARMVPAEWARERLVLPVLLDGGTVTVVVAKPPLGDELETVQRFTCARRVEPAISTSDTIRQLISAIHQDGCGEEISIMELLERARTAGAVTVGASMRGSGTRGWFRGPVGIVRCCVTRGWEDDLHLALSPDRNLPAGRVETWPAILTTGGRARRVECAFVRSAGGVEWTIDLGLEIPLGSARPAVDDALLEAVRNRSGHGVVIAANGGTGVPDEMLELLIPLLPAAIEGVAPRSVHVTDRPVACLPDVMLLDGRPDPGGTIAGLGSLDLDAITLDLDCYDSSVLAAAGAAAPLVVLRAGIAAHAPHADLDVELQDTGDSLRWSLRTPTSTHGAD